MKKLIFFTIVMSMLTCSNYYQVKDEVFGDKEILNYEYSNRYYVTEVRQAHFNVNVEINAPYIVDFPGFSVDEIYPFARIDGVAVYIVRLNESGSIDSVTLVKRAGLGLDSFVGDLVDRAKFSPLYHRGKASRSSFVMKVRVKG